VGFVDDQGVDVRPIRILWGKRLSLQRRDLIVGARVHHVLSDLFLVVRLQSSRNYDLCCAAGVFGHCKARETFARA
jgi:hypothetical protein